MTIHAVPTTVGIRTLNQRTRHVLDMVAEGQAVIITDHGHPIARIVPIASSPLEQLIAAGEYVGEINAPLAGLPGPADVNMPTTEESLRSTREDRV